MKRHGNLWNKIIDKDNLLLAFKKAKRHKSWQQKVIKVEQNLEEMIEKLRESLINGTYKTSGYRQKKIYEPKERTIYILPFYPDRIVHHAIMNILEPIWDKLFISDSYACRKNKGQHKGSIKCMEYVRKNRFCLKCDISKFYPSINHEILKRIIRKKIKCKRTIAQIQIELHGELRVIFTNSTVLKEQLQRYKEHLPFCTTIIKNNKYFSFS